MVGSRSSVSSVATHLHELNPGILNVHCIAHHTALHWSVQAGNEIPYLKKVKDWLAALWEHFYYSLVQAASLVEVH